MVPFGYFPRYDLTTGFCALICTLCAFAPQLFARPLRSSHCLFTAVLSLASPPLSSLGIQCSASPPRFFPRLAVPPPTFLCVHRLAFAGTANVLFSESPCLSDSSLLSCSPCHCHPFRSTLLHASAGRCLAFLLRRVRVPAFDSVPLLCASSAKHPSWPGIARTVLPRFSCMLL